MFQALRDQWDKLIAFASKPPYEVLFNILFIGSCFPHNLCSSLKVALGSLHQQVLEAGLSCVEQHSCIFAMLFYRCVLIPNSNTSDLLYPFNIRTNQAVSVHQPRIVQLQELVRSSPRENSSGNQDGWELVRTTDGAPGGSRKIQLRGTGGIVSSVVTSTLSDLMTALLLCCVDDCCELNDDAAFGGAACVWSCVVFCGIIVCCTRPARFARPCTCCSCCSQTCILKRTLPAASPWPISEF